MARIRTVKPELFLHSELYDAEKDSGLPLRLSFIALFTCCDREGRFRWKPRELKVACLPYDDVDFSRVLDVLHLAGFVEKYDVDGLTYGAIPTWKKHQSVNMREAQSVIPDVGSSGHVHARARTSLHVPGGQNIPHGLRAKILARDGAKCLRCPSVEDLTIDHIFPRSIGGTHAEANLRVLCRKCNSARPVSGDALLQDLERDGLTMDDMQRICMHVHARVEGKGREGEQEGKGNRKGMEGEPIGSVTEPVTDLSVEKNLQSEPQHEGARADHRDPAITELVEYASAKLRENGLPGGLDSDWIATKGGKRLDGNRAAARNILTKLAKDYPNHEASDSAKHLVDVALRDPFHKTNFTRLSYLYRHMTAIIQNHKNPRNHGQQSASDKFAGALEILQSGALSGGLFAGSSPYSEP